MLGSMNVAREWGLSPEEWWLRSKEDKILMIAQTRGMANIQAMVQYDENEKRKRESKANSNKGRKGRRR